MRVIDATHMEVVTLGLPWRHAVSPCSKQAISLLERNTKVVTWLMPKGGSARDQIPCILYKDRYFSLSLRMQKAIYRHIRLKKGFKNEETVNGLSKLRIPDLLLKEKIPVGLRNAIRAAPEASAASAKRDVGGLVGCRVAGGMRGSSTVGASRLSAVGALFPLCRFPSLPARTDSSSSSLLAVSAASP